MTPELKAKWVSALRGGKYKQGRDRLIVSSVESGDSYCCLGVLCAVMGLQHQTGTSDEPQRGSGGGWLDTSDDKQHFVGADGGSMYLWLDHNTANQAGLAYSFRGDPDHSQDTLMKLNNRLSFEQIADWIEENIR